MSRLCPHPDPIHVQGDVYSAEEVIALVGTQLTPERRARIDAVIAGRTYTVTPVLEGLYDRGNASAVLRSAEALGYQAVHLIETNTAFKKANRVTQGAEKWLDIYRWPSTAACVQHLREQGYRIFATAMEDAVPLGDISFHEPAAIVFGNEMRGVTQELLEAADARVMVPMTGFTRSFNISVAAALSLYHIQQDRIRRTGVHGDLTDAERRSLTAQYYLRSVRDSDNMLPCLRNMQASRE